MPTAKFRNTVDSATAPASTCFPIAPDDLAELSHVTKGIYVGQGGDVTLRTIRSDTDVTFCNVPAGYVLDVRVLAVRATGTTASDIVGMA